MRALAHRHMDCSNSLQSRADALIRYLQSATGLFFLPELDGNVAVRAILSGCAGARFLGQTKALLTECKNGNLKMLTFKVGACATPASGKAMAEYYLSATLTTDPAVAAAAYYYAGAEAEQHSAAASNGATRKIREGATVALLRRDISAALAARLGIAAPARPLTQDQIANLLNARRLDGNAIEGTQKA